MTKTARCSLTVPDQVRHLAQNDAVALHAPIGVRRGAGGNPAPLHGLDAIDARSVTSQFALLTDAIAISSVKETHVYGFLMWRWAGRS